LASGPVALLRIEDPVEVDSTLRHHLDLGFACLILQVPPGLTPTLPEDAADRIFLTSYAPLTDGPVTDAATRVLRALPEGTWLYWGYGAEYLFYPFRENRSVRDMLAFHSEERRTGMLAMVVDLYGTDLSAHPNGVDPADAHFDGRGYYARPAEDAQNGYAPMDRQVELYGGLRWRFEEHMPWTRRRIDRIALVQARRGRRLLPDGTTNDHETNTAQCPWHHNMTACIASFRTAKALCTNPNSRRQVTRLHWSGSTRFDWSSRQLMDLGLMEPGQWF